MEERMALGVNASPHSRGNTATMVAEVLRAAEDSGHHAKQVCLGDLRLGPLEAGDADDPYEVKGPEDDMVGLFDDLERMSAFVFGSPIYFDHITAQGKAFIDRLIRYSSGDLKGKFPVGVAAVILITYEWDNPNAYDDVIEWTKQRFEHYFKMRVVATLAAEDTTDRPVASRPEVLKAAYEAGLKL